MAIKKKRSAARPESALTFNHAMIYVRDVRRALHFYQTLLGFRLIEEFPGEVPVYARLKSPRGNSTIALHQAEAGQDLPGSQGTRLYFETSKLDALCKNLGAVGADIPQPPKQMPWGWRHAYLKDPDGHEVSLYTAGAKRLRRSN